MTTQLGCLRGTLREETQVAREPGGQHLLGSAPDQCRGPRGARLENGENKSASLEGCCGAAARSGKVSSSAPGRGCPYADAEGRAGPLSSKVDFSRKQDVPRGGPAALVLGLLCVL